MERQVCINKQQKNLTRQELESLEKAELIDKVIQLQAYNQQLKNILQKKLDADSLGGDVDKPPTKTKRKFDFNKCHKRHVLLKFLYFGWDYQGLAVQEDSNATIEYHLFKALTRTCLIESRATSNYHRCGRTDKEVSAFCQVISIDLRSKFPEDEQLTECGIDNEIDYCGLLNKVFPKNIQCIAWMPLRLKDYSARFDCKSRMYRYFFPIGSLNIEAMRLGCTLLSNAENADFRNFCKMDVNNGVTNYKRHIYSATIQECPNQEDYGGYRMCFLEIKANSFLWHQIRCIVAVLFLIGEGKEQPAVIGELLDVESNPCKPQYSPAAAMPLNLYNCEFREKSENKKDVSENEKQSLNDTTEWVYNEKNLLSLVETVQHEWTQYSIKAVMIRDVLGSLESLIRKLYGRCDVKAQTDALQERIRCKRYKELMTRKRCESLENRIDHFVKKQRLVVKTSPDDASC